MKSRLPVCYLPHARLLYQKLVHGPYVTPEAAQTPEAGQVRFATTPRAQSRRGARCSGSRRCRFWKRAPEVAVAARPRHGSMSARGFRQTAPMRTAAIAPPGAKGGRIPPLCRPLSDFISRASQLRSVTKWRCKRGQLCRLCSDGRPGCNRITNL